MTREHCMLACLLALTLLQDAGAAPPAAAVAPPRERFEHADVLYDWVGNSRGDRLRTFVTRPKGATAAVPAIFFVGWLSCDSVESPGGETDGFAALIRRLIDQSGFATVRTEKPGVGESLGTRCDRADFRGELEDFDYPSEAIAASLQRLPMVARG